MIEFKYSLSCLNSREVMIPGQCLRHSASDKSSASRRLGIQAKKAVQRHWECDDIGYHKLRVIYEEVCK